MILWVILFISLLQVPDVFAVDRYMAPTGNDANTCVQSENIDTPKRTWNSIRTCMVAGDTTYIYSGTYNEYFRMTNMQGTDTVRFRIIGYGPTAPKFLAQRTTTACRAILTASTTIGFWVENLHFDGEGICGPSGILSNVTGNRMENASYITWRNVEWSWMAGDHLVINSSNITYSGGSHHDAYSDCAAHGRSYAFYINKSARNIIVENLDIYGFPGGGIQVYPGVSDSITIRRNRIHHNAYCTSTPQGGITVFRDTISSTGRITNVQIYDNVIYKNASPTGGRGHGIRIGGDIDGAKVYNNTVVYNENNSASGDPAYGIILQTSTCNGVTCVPSNTEIKNNLVIGNEGGQISTTVGTGTVLQGNITTGVGSDYFVNIATDDYRLKQGTNTARDAGVAVSTRSAPVGAPDVGAYEQGKLESATVVNELIEVTTSVLLGPLSPTTGISGVSITCIGCAGTPVATTVLKSGAATVLQVSISGLSTSGSCSINLGSTNLKDSAFVGSLAAELSQGLNSVTGLSVSGTCVNTGGGTPPSGGLELHYPLNENTGSSVSDTSGNARTGTLSGSPTWVTPVAEGAGVYFPNDAVDRRLTSPYGSGIVLTSQSLSFCFWVKMDSGSLTKIVFGPTNGTDQRLYAGVNNNGTWSLGVRNSGFSANGASEFPATTALTHICVVANSSTDVATLYVNAVKGTSSSAVKSFSTGLTLAGNFLAGCGHFTSSQVYCGGYTIDRVKIWSSALSDAEVLSEYESIIPPGNSIACYKQATHKAELVYTDGINPIAYGASAASTYEVIDGGGIAAIIQIDCTGSSGGPIAFQFFYSTDGTNFNNAIPQQLGASGIAMWGSSAEPGLNQGPAVCCISGGLTANNGVTMISSNVTPTINLGANHSYTVRLLLRFASGLTGQSRWIQARQDNGQPLATAPTLGPMRFNFISPRGSIF